MNAHMHSRERCHMCSYAHSHALTRINIYMLPHAHSHALTLMNALTCTCSNTLSSICTLSYALPHTSLKHATKRSHSPFLALLHTCCHAILHALSFTWILVRLSFPPLMHFHINLLMHALSLTLSHALSYACILESTCLHALVHCYMHHSSTPCAWTHSGPLPRILSCTQSIMWLSFQSSWMSVTRSAML